MKIGIDLEENSRFDLEKDSVFLKNNFTEEEIEYAFKKSMPYMHLCANFCVKEALIKTLEDNEKLTNLDIFVSHGKNGKPEIFIKKSSLSKLYDFEVSISHTKNYSTAVVLKMKK